MSQLGGAEREQPNTPPELAIEAHVRYLASFARVWEEEDDEEEHEPKQGARAAGAGAAAADGALPRARRSTPPLEHVATEHFWLSGLYWGLTALYLLGRLDASLDTDKAWRWVQRCFKRVGGVEQGEGEEADQQQQQEEEEVPQQQEDEGERPRRCGARGGGSVASPRHDVHMLSTTSAVQVAALLGRMDELDAEAIEECELVVLFGGWFFWGARAAAGHAPGSCSLSISPLTKPPAKRQHPPPPICKTTTTNTQTSRPCSSRTARSRATGGERSTRASRTAPS
jgi:hypothetical protein